MTMHLLPCYYTTTGSGKVKKSKSARLSKSQADHEAWVKSMTGGKKADTRSIDKQALVEYVENMRVDRDKYTSTGVTPGACAKPESKVYSGERKLLGIATMHKSNMVPVFADNKEAAIDIARMRRG
jgi:hypothetical protein